MWSVTSANDSCETIERSGDDAAPVNHLSNARTAKLTSPRGPGTDATTYDSVTRASPAGSAGETKTLVTTVELAAAGTNASLSLAPCG